MIHLRSVAKRFGQREVLTGLVADIATGRVTGLVGPNGAGKTTLLKLLLGLATPDAGTIAVGSHLLDGTANYRADIGYMPQIVNFPAHLSGQELLRTLAALRGTAVVPDLSLADAFELGDAFERPLGVLSGGTRQKINAILAFAFRPALLVLDEPTSGLDPVAARVLRERILAERAAGTTVLITSHVLQELEMVAEDVLFLADGRARWQGAIQQLKATTGESSLEGAIASLLTGRARMAVA
ncbi:MAG: ABC transporter ATP-binding protein [Gemmatimonadales bacterium]